MVTPRPDFADTYRPARAFEFLIQHIDGVLPLPGRHHPTPRLTPVPDLQPP
jgi:hypothetical protein